VCTTAFTAGDTATWRLFDNNGGVPGTAITTLGSANPPTVPTNANYTFNSGVTLLAGQTYWVVGSAASWSGWCLTNPTTAPSGLFTYVGDFATSNSGTSWGSAGGIIKIIEIDADVTTDPVDPPVPAEPVPGCDATITIPAQAVMGTFTENALLYWKPGAATWPNLFVDAGKSYRVIGQDESGQFRQILLNCQYMWVETDTVGPNYDYPWNGQPLPTDVVE
jgi:hypothetical protein